MILDTCFLISIQNSEKSAVEKSIHIEASSEEARIPYVSICELYVGVGKGTKTKKNRKKVEEVLSEFKFEPATPQIMRTAGEYEGQIQRDHENGIGLADVVIGATAAKLDEPIVTQNISDFKKIPAEITLEPY